MSPTTSLRNEKNVCNCGKEKVLMVEYNNTKHILNMFTQIKFISDTTNI